MAKENNKTQPFLEIKDLSVYFENGIHNVVKAVDDVSLEINKGEIVSLVGESGSGKTTLGKAVLSLVPYVKGEISLDGRVLPSTPELRNKHNNYKWLAKNVQMIFQDPYSSLHPSWSVFRVVADGIRHHSDFHDKRAGFKHTKDILYWKRFFELTEINKKAEIKNLINSRERNRLLKESRDKELSVISSKIKTLTNQIKYKKALARPIKSSNPKEYARQLEEIQDLKDQVVELKTEYKSAKVLKADHKGKLLTEKEIKEKLNKYKEEYSDHESKLPAQWEQELQVMKDDSEEKLSLLIEKLKKQMVEEIEEINQSDDPRNVKALKRKQKRAFIRYSIKNAKDDARTALMTNEKKMIKKFSKGHPHFFAKLLVKFESRKYSRTQFKRYIFTQCADMLKNVGMDKSLLFQPVSDLSGGQRQRVAIVRAILMNPKFIVADEPISALDVSMQAQVVNIINYLKDKFNLTILFIAHDLRMVKYVSDKIYVMFRGKVVEYGDIDEVFDNPIHPYTKTLLSAIPSIDQKSEGVISKKGIEVFEYDLTKNLAERDEHNFIQIGKKYHYALGTDELIKKWKK